MSHAPPSSHTIAEISHLNGEPTLLQCIAVEKDAATHTGNFFYPSFTQAMEIAERSGHVHTPYRVQQAEVPILATEDEFS